MAVKELETWIASEYLTIDAVKQIARIFKEEHAIQLPQFFLPKRLSQLKRELKRWKRAYEPQSHSFAHTTLPVSFAQFLNSPAFLGYLELLTGYKHLVSDGALQLAHRDYVMLSHASAKKQLRLALALTTTSIKEGGVLTYKHPDGDVLEITPKENTLALVEQGKERQEYISYVNHHTKKPVVYLMVHGK